MQLFKSHIIYLKATLWDYRIIFSSGLITYQPDGIVSVLNSGFSTTFSASYLPKFVDRRHSILRNLAIITLKLSGQNFLIALHKATEVALQDHTDSIMI